MSNHHRNEWIETFHNSNGFAAEMNEKIFKGLHWKGMTTDQLLQAMSEAPQDLVESYCHLRNQYDASQSTGWKLADKCGLDKFATTPPAPVSQPQQQEPTMSTNDQLALVRRKHFPNLSDAEFAQVCGSDSGDSSHDHETSQQRNERLNKTTNPADALAAATAEAKAYQDRQLAARGMDLSPERRRELLEMTPTGRAMLSEEEKNGQAEGANDLATGIKAGRDYQNQQLAARGLNPAK